MCALSFTTWRLFTGVPARCIVIRVRSPWPLGFPFTVVPAWFVVLRLRCPQLLHASSKICTLGVLCCVCGVLGHLATVHRFACWVCCVVGVFGHFSPLHWCASSVCCVACTVSLATSSQLKNLHTCCVVLRVRCPWPLG